MERNNDRSERMIGDKKDSKVNKVNNNDGSCASTADVTRAVVEARPVKEEADVEAKVVYADSVPLSLKHVISERPVQRLLVIAPLLVVGLIMGIILYFVLTTDGDNNKDPNSRGTGIPTMAPSAPPTAIPPIQSGPKISSVKFQNVVTLCHQSPESCSTVGH